MVGRGRVSGSLRVYLAEDLRSDPSSRPGSPYLADGSHLRTGVGSLHWGAYRANLARGSNERRPIVLQRCEGRLPVGDVGWLPCIHNQWIRTRRQEDRSVYFPSCDGAWLGDCRLVRTFFCAIGSHHGSQSPCTHEILMERGRERPHHRRRRNSGGHPICADYAVDVSLFWHGVFAVFIGHADRDRTVYILCRGRTSGPETAEDSRGQDALSQLESARWSNRPHAVSLPSLWRDRLGGVIWAGLLSGGGPSAGPLCHDTYL